MKPTDLQIRDWVSYIGKDFNDYVDRVSGIIDGCVVLDKEMIHRSIDNIRPIPLTPEILEKNGFYFGYTSDEEDLASNTIAQLSEEDKGWVWDEGDGSIKVILPNESDGGMIIIDDQSFDRHLSLVYNNEVYVHEVQHALRICGLNELADNLKME